MCMYANNGNKVDVQVKWFFHRKTEPLCSPTLKFVEYPNQLVLSTMFEIKDSFKHIQHYYDYPALKP